MNEKALLERPQRQLEELQRLAKLGSWEYDTGEDRVTWTDGLYHIYGLTRDTFPATFEGYLALAHPDDRDRVARTVRDALERAGSFEFEERIIRPDGNVRTLVCVGRTVTNGSEGASQLVGVCRDITEEKEVRAGLARREQQFAQAQQIAHLGSWMFDVAANAITWSEEMYRIYGIPANTPLDYEKYTSHIHPDDLLRVTANVQRALSAGAAFEHEHRIRRVDGTERIIMGYGDVERGADGVITRLFGTAQDVTERRKVEEQARELIREQGAREEAERAANSLQFIADASVILASSLEYEETLRNVARLAVPAVADWCAVDIVTQDNEVKRLAVEHADPAKVHFAMQIEERYPSDPNAPTGVPNVLRTGETEWMAFIPDDLLAASAIDADHLRLIRELGLHSYAVVPLKVGSETIGAMTFVQAESRRQFSEADITLLTSVARRAATAIHNARLMRELSDAHARLQGQREELESQATELEEAMTELEMRNEELETKTSEAEQARQDAEQANAAKSQFLANMSHELRTPLNAIGGYAQLIELGVHGPISDAARSAIERIRTNQLRLLALINDLLNFVKLRAGRLEITLSPERLTDLLEGLPPLVELQMKEKGLTLTIDAGPAGLFVHTNRERTEQVLLNLVANAIKFTDRGGTIAIQAEPLENAVLIHVTDTGIGIPADRINEIFEPFIQLAQLPMRDNQGVGLGLAISRDLMNGMGGDLTVKSEPGAGSRFTMTLARATEASVVVENEVAL